MVVGVDRSSEGEAGGVVVVGEGVEVEFEGVEYAKNSEGVFVLDA